MTNHNQPTDQNTPTYGRLPIHIDVTATFSAWYGMTMGTAEDKIAHQNLVEQLKAHAHRFSEQNNLDPTDLREVSTLEGASVQLKAKKREPEL